MAGPFRAVYQLICRKTFSPTNINSKFRGDCDASRSRKGRARNSKTWGIQEQHGSVIHPGNLLDYLELSSSKMQIELGRHPGARATLTAWSLSAPRRSRCSALYGRGGSKCFQPNTTFPMRTDTLPANRPRKFHHGPRDFSAGYPHRFCSYPPRRRGFNLHVA